MATIRSQVSINSNLLSNCSNDRFGFKLICYVRIKQEAIGSSSVTDGFL